MKPTTQTFKNVTLYTRGDSMAMTSELRKIECRTLTIEVGPYAQHENGITVRFLQKGKRNERQFSQSYRADVVVLDGHGHMEPDGAFLPENISATPSVVVQRGRYMSCDPRWQGDFDAKLAAYLDASKATVAADLRGHVFTDRTTWRDSSDE
jgi:hypothetical protein